MVLSFVRIIGPENIGKNGRQNFGTFLTLSNEPLSNEIFSQERG